MTVLQATVRSVQNVVMNIDINYCFGITPAQNKRSAVSKLYSFFINYALLYPTDLHTMMEKATVNYFTIFP